MSEVYESTNQSEVEQIIDFDKRVVVKFTAPSWCRPCIQFAPVYKAVAERDETGTTFLSVDIDNAPWAMADYGVQGVPTVVLFENGVRVRDLKERTAIKFMSELS